MRRMFGFLIGIFVGGFVGSVIALLLAPESGENLRTELRERGQGFMNDIRHSADSRRIELRHRLETMRAARDVRVSKYTVTLPCLRVYVVYDVYFTASS